MFESSLGDTAGPWVLLKGCIRCKSVSAVSAISILNVHYWPYRNSTVLRTVPGVTSTLWSQARSALMIPFRKMLSGASSWRKEAHTAAWLRAPQAASDNCISKQCGSWHQRMRLLIAFYSPHICYGGVLWVRCGGPWLVRGCRYAKR